MNILGLDPGFASLGWSVVQLSATDEVIVAAGVHHTEKSDKKRAVLASDDNLRRAREIASFLAKLCMEHKVTAICAESMSWPRNASAAAKVALAWGVIAAVSHALDLPIVQSSPKEVKKAVCGNGSASKEDVEAAVMRRYGVSSFPAKINKTDREHLFDSTAVVVACLESEVLRLLRRQAA